MRNAGYTLEDLPSPHKQNLNGRSSDSRIILLAAPSHPFKNEIFKKGLEMNSGIWRLSFPITAAGPYRIFTGFPIMP